MAQALQGGDQDPRASEAQGLTSLSWPLQADLQPEFTAPDPTL